MITAIARILSWILPPPGAPESKRAHLRKNLYIASNESIENPPVRDDVGRKDVVWDNTVNDVINKTSQVCRFPVQRIARISGTLAHRDPGRYINSIHIII